MSKFWQLNASKHFPLLQVENHLPMGIVFSLIIGFKQTPLCCGKLLLYFRFTEIFSLETRHKYWVGFCVFAVLTRFIKSWESRKIYLSFFMHYQHFNQKLSTNSATFPIQKPFLLLNYWIIRQIGSTTKIFRVFNLFFSHQIGVNSASRSFFRNLDCGRSH